ncbi:MAG TPA: hypothetical protein VFK93_03310 [Candidatus Limnocylindria bacterium]|nr:hypothetical protein [Candidatus Limnocylindria bacterium]
MASHGSAVLALWTVLVIAALTAAYALDLWRRRHGRDGLTTEQWLWFGGVLVLGLAVGTLMHGGGWQYESLAAAPSFLFAGLNAAAWAGRRVERRDVWRLLSAGIWLLFALVILVL